MLRFIAALWLAGAASPSLAAQAPAIPERLARDGFTAAPPAGFSAFQPLEVPGDTLAWYYTSRSGDTVILLSVVGPISSWIGGTREEARVYLDGMNEMLHRSAVQEPEVVVEEDGTHFRSTAAAVTYTRLGRGITRVYVAREGAPRALGIQVLDRSGNTSTPFDPAADPAIRAFLDAARLPPDDGRSLDPWVFRDAGVEIQVPAGFTRLSEGYRNVSEGVRIYRSTNGSRGLAVVIMENLERGAEAWPPERRIRHMRRVMDPMARAWGQVEEGELTTGSLAYRDFWVTRMDGDRASGRGRMYTTESGPHRLILVMHYEKNAARPVDIQAMTRMLNSVRVLSEEDDYP